MIKRYAPYILIPIILAGFFSPVTGVSAQASVPASGICSDPNNLNRPVPGITTAEDCKAPYRWTTTNADGTATTAPARTDGSAFGARVSGCAAITGDFDDCIVKLAYYLFYALPAFLLGVVANFFNVIIAIALSGKMYAWPFLSEAWAVIRDLSNIFFIIVLLYIALQTILGLDKHGGPKKMIAQVIIMALFINFSMFFTKVVIDASNILALVFYNKINVETTIQNADGTTDSRPYIPVIDPAKTGLADKDLSGGIVSAFDPTKMLSDEFFEKAKTKSQAVSPSLAGFAVYTGGGALAGSVVPIIGTTAGAVVGAGGYAVKSIVGYFFPSDEVPNSLMLGIIVLSGLIISFAAYAFFIAGFSFLGRLIELWTLIIFAPFAFMSSILPKLSSIPGIGWENWVKRLFSAAFMAPIFLFFVYLIFKLVSSNVFSSLSDRSFKDQGTLEALILLLIPAIAILILLMSAVKYAKKGGGQFGDAVFQGAKVLGGLAIGGAALGTAAIGRGLIGTTAKYIQNDAARAKDLKFGTNVASFAPKGLNRFNPLAWAGAGARTVGAGGKFINAGAAELIHKTGLGAKMKTADESFGRQTHATHILDAKMQSEFGHQYGKDAKFKDLSEFEQGIVKKEIEKDEMAKFTYGKLFKDLEAPQAQLIQHDYNSGLRAIDDGHGKTVGIAATPGAAPGGTKFKSDYFVDMSKVNAAMGEFVQALRKGTYDVRNLPEMKGKTSEGFSKTGVALIAGVAAGVRLGIKKGVGIEHYGTPQKDVLQDIGDTISEALKNAKITFTAGGGGDKDRGTKEVKSVGH